jgi:RNA polymerase sigma-70 factor (sigma-E family)
MRDESSYVEFVSVRWTSLFRLAYLLTGSEHAAEDLLQTALLRVFVAWPKVQRTEAPDAYVRRVLVNAAISDGRRRARRPEVLSDDVPEPTGPGSNADAPEGADGVVDRDALWPLVEALPPRQRAVVVLRYYEDLTEREIATILGCAPGTVKSQASAAMKSLRNALAEVPTGEPT